MSTAFDGLITTNRIHGNSIVREARIYGGATAFPASHVLVRDYRKANHGTSEVLGSFRVTQSKQRVSAVTIEQNTQPPTFHSDMAVIWGIIRLSRKKQKVT
jgi:hypothetical protein